MKLAVSSTVGEKLTKEAFLQKHLRILFFVSDFLRLNIKILKANN